MKHIPTLGVHCCGSKLLVRLLLVCPLLFALVACTGPPRQHVDPRPIPTVERRVAFGAIGIAVAGDANPRTPNAPKSLSNLKKAGMTVGTGAAGAGVGAILGLTCGPSAWFCVPAMAGAGGFAGALGGAAGSIPYRTAEQVNNADITIHNALHSVDVADRLVEAVLAQAPRMPELDLKRINYSREEDSWDLENELDGIDTRLLIETPKIALATLNESTDWNPNVRLEIVVEGKIFEEHQERPSFERRWLYFSDVHNYFEWAEEDGSLVLSELERALSNLSDRIIADFLQGNREKSPQSSMND